jgi:Helix-turn-helix domain
LVPLPASPLPSAAELLPEWLKRSKPLTHPLPLPADGPHTRAEGARKPRHPPADGLKTAVQAAAKLGCSVKTLNGHIASGALRYVDVGHGKKRRRIRFTDADLNEFIANQTRKDVPCPSTRTETAARRISTSTSKCEVIGFTARRDARRGVKPKK